MSDDIKRVLADHALWLAGEGGKRAHLYSADLSHANLSSANLSDADLSDADLSDADLSDADLSGANLSGADLFGADLFRVDLFGADLFRVDLSGADLTRSNLRDADLSGANLRGAHLYSADLTGADLSDAVLSCSRGVIWSQHGPIGTDARILTAVWHGPDEGVILHAGECFRGSVAEFEQRCNEGGKGWGWPVDFADIRDRCITAARRCVADIEIWLQACEKVPR